MKLFLIEYAGVYLEAAAMVFASSKKEAIAELRKIHISQLLCQKVTEIPIPTKPTVVYNDIGDY